MEKEIRTTELSTLEKAILGFSILTWWINIDLDIKHYNHTPGREQETKQAN
jgi:hypothetical protein